jgi:hypothetical protein
MTSPRVTQAVVHVEDDSAPGGWRTMRGDEARAYIRQQREQAAEEQRRKDMHVLGRRLGPLTRLLLDQLSESSGLPGPELLSRKLGRPAALEVMQAAGMPAPAEWLMAEQADADWRRDVRRGSDIWESSLDHDPRYLDGSIFHPGVLESIAADEMEHPRKRNAARFALQAFERGASVAEAIDAAAARPLSSNPEPGAQFPGLLQQAGIMDGLSTAAALCAHAPMGVAVDRDTGVPLQVSRPYPGEDAEPASAMPQPAPRESVYAGIGTSSPATPEAPGAT